MLKLSRVRNASSCRTGCARRTNISAFSTVVVVEVLVDACAVAEEITCPTRTGAIVTELPFPEQELPHLPQLLPSYFTSTHFPSQSTSSSTHPHVPLTQERPAGQTFPHEPQADSSLFRSAQCVPLHSVIPFGRMRFGQRTNCLLFQNSTMSKQTKLYN